ncbi:MAG: hypothetical protein KC635_23685 [Myxococcales bacterium]|nr:hypothetical protein [Myxococcales bacterium]MCB9737113.1 hypothetical protein [Deltaproteobacteria bacterium]
MSTDRAALLRLRAEVLRDLGAADALRADLAGRSDAIERGDDPVLLGYAAIVLHQLYTALETLFERICRVLEGSLPSGRDSHQALLSDMTLELPGLRPAVLAARTADELAVLLRFRHFVRHAYAVAWDPTRLSDVVSATARVWPAVDRDLRAFLAFLDDVLAEVDA